MLLNINNEIGLKYNEKYLSKYFELAVPANIVLMLIVLHTVVNAVLWTLHLRLILGEFRLRDLSWLRNP